MFWKTEIFFSGRLDRILPTRPVGQISWLFFMQRGEGKACRFMPVHICRPHFENLRL